MPLNGEYLPGTAEWARVQAETIEASGGAEASELHGKPVIVLTTVGAVTGGLRKTALMRVEHAGSYAVVASKGGAPDEPKWAGNMRKSPLVEVQDGPAKGDFLAREADGDERAAWWARAVEAWPDYEQYQLKTDRRIAVFVLDPA